MLSVGLFPKNTTHASHTSMCLVHRWFMNRRSVAPSLRCCISQVLLEAWMEKNLIFMFYVNMGKSRIGEIFAGIKYGTITLHDNPANHWIDETNKKIALLWRVYSLSVWTKGVNGNFCNRSHNNSDLYKPHRWICNSEYAFMTIRANQKAAKEYIKWQGYPIIHLN